MTDHKAEYDEEMMRRYELLELVKKELSATALDIVRSNEANLPPGWNDTEDMAFEHAIHDDKFHLVLEEILGTIYIANPWRKELFIYARRILESDMGM